ncbi:zinc finger protein ubi-d4-like [Diorhabda sublineata]|uniref:zinc finger protein ubi-d4-like n=1 Tax=Diorhabda sublineata TaxID=1163346 RepID=UPI0024E10E0F|nr:zinc finger protein ubi-d4-like [Diorhabda sublineata]
MSNVTTASCPEQSNSLINKTTTEKIENSINNSAYNEAIENSSNYNTRLCIERRLRLPFIDTQTGVAQNHSSLYINRRQRIPGLLSGQIYSYPRQRWRKRKSQYLTMNARAFSRAADHLLEGSDGDIHSISQIENPALQDTDSKDSQLLKDDVPKEWFYDEADMLEMDNYDEPDPDSDLDYEECYSKRRRGRRGAGRGRGVVDSPSTPNRRKGSGRGRKKSSHNFEPTPGDPDKPFACELCGARYKTRPGLTYHYGHSHKEGASDENSRDSTAPTPPTSGASISSGFSNVQMVPNPQVIPPQPAGSPPVGSSVLSAVAPDASTSNKNDLGQVYQDSYVSFLNQTPGAPLRRGRPSPSHGLPPVSLSAVLNQNQGPPPNLPPNLPEELSPPLEDPQMPVLIPEKALDLGTVGADMSGSVLENTVTSSIPESSKKPASPYCDFCLGDSRENKKTGIQEELVSCSDCGRSGHPTCLQFTNNMKISVKTYRWQCIECKCCSVCGNSDNDDQLLFCDDCDRGYHMYCLSPALVNPPEGSWSCKLCIDQFHK